MVSSHRLTVSLPISRGWQKSTGLSGGLWLVERARGGEGGAGDGSLGRSPGGKDEMLQHRHAALPAEMRNHRKRRR